MRRLILMRHAKTERSNPGGDHARMLEERGRTDAARIAAWMQENGIVPEYVLVSDATRTRETAVAMQPAFTPAAVIACSEKLYLAEAEQILREIWAVPDHAAVLMLIGHNPGMHELAHILAGHGNGDLREQLGAHYPTGALAVLDFQSDSWADIMPGAGTLSQFITPKALRQENRTPEAQTGADGGGHAG